MCFLSGTVIAELSTFCYIAADIARAILKYAPNVAITDERRSKEWKKKNEKEIIFFFHEFSDGFLSFTVTDDGDLNHSKTLLHSSSFSFSFSFSFEVTF